jgi:hypothetical protein
MVAARLSFCGLTSQVVGSKQKRTHDGGLKVTSAMKDPPLTPHSSLLSPYSSLLPPYFSLLTTHYSPLTTHYSLLTAHCSLLTTHHLLQVVSAMKIVRVRAQATAADGGGDRRLVGVEVLGAQLDRLLRAMGEAAADLQADKVPRPTEAKVKAGAGAPLERRYDDDGGGGQKLYTKAEFVELYGGTTEWQRAAREQQQQPGNSASAPIDLEAELRHYGGAAAGGAARVLSGQATAAHRALHQGRPQPRTAAAAEEEELQCAIRASLADHAASASASAPGRAACGALSPSASRTNHAAADADANGADAGGMSADLKAKLREQLQAGSGGGGGAGVGGAPSLRQLMAMRAGTAGGGGQPQRHSRGDALQLGGEAQRATLQAAARRAVLPARFATKAVCKPRTNRTVTTLPPEAYHVPRMGSPQPDRCSTADRHRHRYLEWAAPVAGRPATTALAAAPPMTAVVRAAPTEAAEAAAVAAAVFEVGQTVLVRNVQAEAFQHLNLQLGTVTDVLSVKARRLSDEAEGAGTAAAERYRVQMPGSDRDYDLRPEKLVLAPPRLPTALPAGWRFERASSSRPSEVVLSHRGVHLYARRLDGDVYHLRWDKILKA